MKENFAAKDEIYLPKIKIIGVGNCGMQAVNSIVEKRIGNTDLFVINSDKEILALSMLNDSQRIQIGEKITNGLGTGGNPNVGKKAAEESIEKIREIVKGTDILFVINGIAGGTAGAVPLITKLAKEQGAINIVFAVTPAHFEGKRKTEYADKALQKFMDEESCIDSVINVSSERFIELVDRKSTLNDVFNLANEEISKCIKAFVDIFHGEEGPINLRFKDFKAFFKYVGFTGIGISKIHKFAEYKSAADEVMNDSLIRGSFESAKKVIISINGGRNLMLHSIHEITEEITNKIKNDAEVMLSVQIDKDSLSAGEFKITVITA